MATYEQIQDWVKMQHGFVPKTCWIAHVLFDYGLTKRTAPNRNSPNARAHPCPADKRAALEAALRHFELI
jgi:23S rRNA (uracil1939-C5)-methyltransferase